VIVRPDTPEDRAFVVSYIAGKIRTTPEALVGQMPFEVLAAVGSDGSLLGAVLYTNFRDQSIEMTSAGTPGWLTRTHLREFFGYPFNQLGVRRVTGIVHRKNKHARNINERLGFKLEGVCRHGFKDGDAMIYGMLKQECRWI
jgi:RimJ/RimL family protein N-acetyltransferase